MTKPNKFLRDVRVLVVEDEALVGEEIRERLSHHGADVVDVVDTGTGAIDAAARLRPDIVLMDIRLKGEMSGIEASERIRRAHDLPVVFLTAHSDWQTVIRAKISDPFGYVLKPFKEADLVTTLAEALRADKPDLRVLFVSGYTDDAVLRHGIEAGKVEFVRKPVSPAELALKVRHILDA